MAPVRLDRVHTAALRCHALSGEAEEGDEPCAGRMLLRLAAGGDKEAAKRLGLALSKLEAEAALAAVQADLVLLALDDDPDLAEPALGSAALVSPRQAGALARLPPAAAEAAKWLSYHTSWCAAVERQASAGAGVGDATEVARRRGLSREARERWLKVVEAEGLGDALGSSAEVLADAAEAMARHTAAFRLSPRDVVAAKEAWTVFEAALAWLEEAQELKTSLLDDLKWMLWNGAWHAANKAAEEDEDEGEEELDEEAETALFGEGYPGSQDDALMDLVRFLRHSLQCHWDSCIVGGSGDGQKWRGVCLPLGATQREVHAAAAVGFNAVRFAIAEPTSAADKWDKEFTRARGVLEACVSDSVAAVLDLSSWSPSSSSSAAPASRRGKKSAGGDKGGPSEAALAGLARVAAAAASCGSVRGVVLPAAAKLCTLEPFVAAVRNGGLAAGRCAVVAALASSAAELLDEEGNFAGLLHEALSQDDEGLLLRDGHLVLEVRRQAEADSPQGLLDEASHAGEDLDSELPPCCIHFGVGWTGPLVAPCRRLGDRWLEELAARHDAAAGHATHGWFVSLDETPGMLQACLGLSDGSGGGANTTACRWTWPDPEAHRIMWPHGTQHSVTLIYLHGFTCDGGSYLCCAEYFYREGKERKDDGDEDDEDDEDEGEAVCYNSYPGLKVVLPTAPLRPISAYDGDRIRSWYDYLTDREGEEEDDSDKATLDESTRRIHALLEQEVAKVGASRVFLGGASQGCCVALHVAATWKGAPLGGIVATQGHLLSCTKWPTDWANRGTPVRVYHGLADETIQWDSWASAAYEPLRKAGGNLKFHTDEGVDHGDDEAEGRWVRDFLSEMFPG
mmetsp:Transcript_3862/g.14358  ORF Transcript_3862/g.14358 Transcript_3862/m.14358 type:complete len:852 (+) Transcript_3862:72-2627(+)